MNTVLCACTDQNKSYSVLIWSKVVDKGSYKHTDLKQYTTDLSSEYKK